MQQKKSSVGVKPSDKAFTNLRNSLRRSKGDGYHLTDALLLMGCGGLAGAVAKTVVAPLERTKLLMQLQGMRSDRQTPADPARRTMLRTMRWVLTTQGIRAFWRGNGANLVRIVPNKAVLFFCNDYYKRIYAASVRKGAAEGTSIPKGCKFLIGAASGATVALTTYPLDFVRTRLCAQEGRVTRYAGMIDCFRQTIRTEGPFGLYRGLVPTLLGIMPYAGLSLLCYETFKSFAPSQDEHGNTSILYKLLSGAGAGCIAQTTVFPIDTVRRRMVMQGEHGGKHMYKNAIDCARQIVRKEGVRGLYHGAYANVVRAIPNTAIQWTVLEESKRYVGL